MSIKIDLNVVLLWLFTHATIPSNFSEDTNFAGRFVLSPAAAGDGGATGGAATHLHPTVGTSHYHAISNGAASGSKQCDFGVYKYTANGHVHSSSNSSNAIITTVGASNEPAYHEVIFIKSNGNGVIEDGIAGFSLAGISGYHLCDGNDGRPNLVDKFLKGVASGGDAGGTGGSDTHSHDSDHLHVAADSGLPKASVVGAGTGEVVSVAHAHPVSLDSATANVSTVDGRPPFYHLQIVINDSGGVLDPNDLIGLWPYSEDSIPDAWERVSAMDGYFVRGGASAGSPGGANQHGHTATHNHPATAGYGDALDLMTSGFAGGFASKGDHGHAWTAANAAASIPNNVSKDNYPPYIEAIFIKYVGSSFIPRLTLLGVG